MIILETVFKLVSSRISYLEPQKAEQFPNKKVPLKIATNHDPGFSFLKLGYHPVIYNSRSDVWDDTNAIISTKAGSYFSNLNHMAILEVNIK